MIITITLTELGKMSRAKGFTNASHYAKQLSEFVDVHVVLADGPYVNFVNGVGRSVR